MSLKKYFSKTAIVTAVAGFSALMVMHACKKPTEGIDLIVTTSPLSKAPTLLRFVNANANSNTNLPSNITVSVSGPGAGLVQVDGGGTNFTAVDGLLPLSLIKAAQPTTNAPVSFTVYASVNGYAPVSRTITITGNNLSTVVIPLVEYAHPAEGTAATVNTTSVNAGTAPATTISTATNTTTTEQSSISIPAGTQLLDATGAVINSAQLKSSVAYFSTGNALSYNATPGSFDARNAVGPNAQPIAAGTTFVTAGQLSINMVAGTTVVKKFSKPVTLSMEINSNLVNPQTRQKVKVGDVIPIWSLDEPTGAWKYESLATVALNANNKMAVTFQITHLSVWSANWFGVTCTSPLKITLRATGPVVEGDFVVALATANNQPVITANFTQIRNGADTTLTDVPAEAGDLKVLVYSRENGALTQIGETVTFSPCTKGAVDVNLGAQTAPVYVKTNIMVSAKCSTKQVVAYPTAWLTLKDATAGTSSHVFMSDGAASANLIEGHSYGISTNYSGRAYNSGVFQLSKAATATIPAVNGLSGTTTYNSEKNIIEVKANFILTDCN